MAEHEWADIVRMVDRGDPLPNDVLRDALRFYGRVADDLRALGPHFHLAWANVSATHRRLEGFRDARKRDGAWRGAAQPSDAQDSTRGETP